MPGRHSSSSDTTELIYIAEEAPRGKHTRMRGRRRRESTVGRAARVTFAGVAAAAVAGSISYGAVSMVTHDSSDGSSQIVAAPPRAGDERASRSGGNCGRTGTGQARVERYLATQAARFGQVSMDASQDATDCAAIKKFQAAVALPAVTGVADDTTAEIADRLYASTPASCAARAGATTVCVDLTHQTLWVMRNGSVAFAPVVIRSGTTPLGEYRITEKDDSSFSQRFNDGLALHATDTSFYTASDKASQASVDLLSGDAKAVYALTEVGSEVHVFDAQAGA